MYVPQWSLDLFEFAWVSLQWLLYCVEGAHRFLLLDRSIHWVTIDLSSLHHPSQDSICGHSSRLLSRFACAITQQCCRSKGARSETTFDSESVTLGDCRALPDERLEAIRRFVKRATALGWFAEENVVDSIQFKFNIFRGWWGRDLETKNLRICN